ncbi:protein slowmo-like isoform X1 [Vespa mandarinia]|uniref:protein slowmo-like isoform X1 n=1 Tax=Vespa mandarinia TaxID=7446 RepID=UPI00161C0264|nr:protein slowmo-like isoform X1 [Vespa mandarinia]XP_046828506.1 protein slowmo isoform X1 [Vespa crabro]XP_047367772.1 protein slowmo isoform X1 [Vespa velutina]
MRIWRTEHTFNHSWETVTQAAWRKYPNPINSSVIGTDVIDRKVIDGILHTHRLVSTRFGFPKWAQALIGHAKICYASEKSEVDPVSREMVLKTRNLTFCNHIAVDETVRYTPHPNDPGKTLLQQEAVVTVSGVPLTHYMEELLTSKICFNSGMGRQAMEWVIEKLHLEEFDDLLTQTVRQFDDLTLKTRRGMDDLQSAIKSFDEIHNLTSSPSSQSMPKF